MADQCALMEAVVALATDEPAPTKLNKLRDTFQQDMQEMRGRPGALMEAVVAPNTIGLLYVTLTGNDTSGF